MLEDLGAEIDKSLELYLEEDTKAEALY